MSADVSDLPQNEAEADGMCTSKLDKHSDNTWWHMSEGRNYLDMLFYGKSNEA
jgi:hypothetical protein